jgi:hypothetical protein
MTPQPIDFFDFWSDLDLALDDARLPEAGFSRALRLWKVVEFTAGDPDKAIAEEVARLVAMKQEAER